MTFKQGMIAWAVALVFAFGLVVGGAERPSPSMSAEKPRTTAPSPKMSEAEHRYYQCLADQHNTRTALKMGGASSKDANLLANDWICENRP